MTDIWVCLINTSIFTWAYGASIPSFYTLPVWQDFKGSYYERKQLKKYVDKWNKEYS